MTVSSYQLLGREREYTRTRRDCEIQVQSSERGLVSREFLSSLYLPL